MKTLSTILASALIAIGAGAQASAAPVFSPLAPFTSDGFRVPQTGTPFIFPRDHGSHPEFKIEWWYFTGHLWGPDKERYGFQVTFFRRSGAPASAPAQAGSERFQTREINLLHVALMDERSGKFIYHEHLARTGWEAESRVGSLFVRHGDTSAKMEDAGEETISLEARIRNDASLLLKLKPSKPLVVFGENGVSRKGDSSTAASWYLTYPRLDATGSLARGDSQIPVTGQVWMDHEISSSQLTEDQVGWDWAGIQLDDGREILSYRLRRKDGSTDPASNLVWVEKTGELTHQNPETFRWISSGVWKSRYSGATYPLPAGIRTKDPKSGKEIELRLEPILMSQELQSPLTGIPYWEGACRVIQEGKPVGSAYVELTGYAGGLKRALAP
jgi:predicted secreted hydrolase